MRDAPYTRRGTPEPGDKARDVPIQDLAMMVAQNRRTPNGRTLADALNEVNRFDGKPRAFQKVLHYAASQTIQGFKSRQKIAENKLTIEMAMKKKREFNK